MKHKAFFSSKDKSKKIKCRLLQFLFGALRVKIDTLSEGSAALELSALQQMSPKLVSFRKRVKVYVFNLMSAADFQGETF